MKDKNIFIHIPKTGGTTIVSAINKSRWQVEVGFNYRHISQKTMQSNSADIFQSENLEKYQSYILFTMLRHPVDRLISEYYFIKERKSFFARIRERPKNLKEYAKSKQTANGTLNFLLGKEMYGRVRPNEKDLEKVLTTFKELPIHVGIFEEFDKSMEYFRDISSIEFEKKINVRRMTFIRPKEEEIDEEIKALILENNQLDLALYEYGKEHFDSVKHKYSKSSIEFVKDKYDHVVPYALQFCVFEFCMNNKRFIKQNLLFFKELTMHLIKKRGIKDGRTYLMVWNASFLKAVEVSFPNSEFSQRLNNSIDKKLEPLKQIEAIANALDHFFVEKGAHAKDFYKPMKFSTEFIVQEKEQTTLKGIFKNLFG